MTTALIAEDEPLLAENLRAELATTWPTLDIVAQAGSGTAAVELALQHRPHVCFLDIRMPGMTGLEAAQAISEDWPAVFPPVARAGGVGIAGVLGVLAGVSPAMRAARLDPSTALA